MIKWFSLLLFLVLAGPQAARAQEVPPQADAVLKQIRASDKDLLAVSEEDGRFMRLLVVTSKTRRALEIGSASGYSAIWIGLGLDPSWQGPSTSSFSTPGSRTIGIF